LIAGFGSNLGKIQTIFHCERGQHQIGQEPRAEYNSIYLLEIEFPYFLDIYCLLKIGTMPRVPGIGIAVCKDLETRGRLKSL